MLVFSSDNFIFNNNNNDGDMSPGYQRIKFYVHFFTVCYVTVLIGVILFLTNSEHIARWSLTNDQIITGEYNNNNDDDGIKDDQIPQQGGDHGHLPVITIELATESIYYISLLIRIWSIVVGFWALSGLNVHCTGYISDISNARVYDHILMGLAIALTSFIVASHDIVSQKLADSLIWCVVIFVVISIFEFSASCVYKRKIRRYNSVHYESCECKRRNEV